MGYQGWLATNALALFCAIRLSATMILTMHDKQDTTRASKVPSGRISTTYIYSVNVYMYYYVNTYFSQTNSTPKGSLLTHWGLGKMSQQSTGINITEKFWLIFLKSSIIVAPLLSDDILMLFFRCHHPAFLTKLLTSQPPKGAWAMNFNMFIVSIPNIIGKISKESIAYGITK